MEVFSECIYIFSVENEIARCAPSKTTAAEDGNCVTLLINDLPYILHLAVLIHIFLLITNLLVGGLLIVMC